MMRIELSDEDMAAIESLRKEEFESYIMAFITLSRIVFGRVDECRRRLAIGTDAASLRGEIASIEAAHKAEIAHVAGLLEALYRRCDHEWPEPPIPSPGKPKTNTCRVCGMVAVDDPEEPF